MTTSGKFRSRAFNKAKKDPGDHDISQCNQAVNGKLIHYKPEHAIEGKETVNVYNSDGTRLLLVPSRNPIDLPGIFPKSELERLRKQAHVVTLQDRMVMLEEANKKTKSQQEASEKRKEELARAQVKKSIKVDGKLSEVQKETKKRNMYQLTRSYELLQEQDDRVKAANGIILATKCRAIRNAQIAEKELIEKQLLEEDHRLDLMMEQRRQEEVEKEENKRIEADFKKQKYVSEVMRQMKENAIEKLLEAERKEEESKAINRVLIALQKEEEEKLKEKNDQKRHLQDELHKWSETSETYKAMKKEEERLADLRVKEFMRQKQEREEALEQEKQLAKAAKEREIAKMRAQQQKALDYQAMVKELNAARVAEEVERKWREKEKIVAQKKKEADDSLIKERHQQIIDLRKSQAIRLAKDEQDFHKVVLLQQQEYEKEIDKRNKTKEEKIKHRKELLKQINEKERERINNLKQKYEEGRAQIIEGSIKDCHVTEYLTQKLEKLKSANLPENYIKDIERQLKVNKIL